MNVQPLTKRQLSELHTTVRHLGRAMAAMGRAGIPTPPRFGGTPDWLGTLYEADDALTAASNRLIDALEALPHD